MLLQVEVTFHCESVTGLLSHVESSVGNVLHCVPGLDPRSIFIVVSVLPAPYVVCVVKLIYVLLILAPPICFKA